MKSGEIAAGVVILAAGRSRRMGRPKMLLPWGETTVLAYLVKQWRTLDVRQVAVVCAENDAAIFAELEQVGLAAAQRVLNDNPDQGMFSSIQCAARWNGWDPTLTHWILVLGDQPHLREQTLRKLMEFAGEYAEAVCQPLYNGHRRHPVVMPKSVFRKLADSSARDLKQFLAPFASATCEINDPGLELDIDNPDDYERAQRFGAVD